MLRSTRINRLVVTFVRHSESVNNVARTQIPDARAFALQKLADPPLTERGVKQAQLAAQRLAVENGGDTSMILTSYFSRALRTASTIETAIKAVNPQSPAKVVVDRDLHEVGGHYVSKEHGPEKVLALGTPGRSSIDVAREFPTFRFVAGQACENGWWSMQHKEDLTAARQRALQLWERLAQVARLPIVGADHANSCAPQIVPIASSPTREELDGRAPTARPQSVIVVMHGHLYSLMMNEAKHAGFFVHDTPPTYERLSNTAITRVQILPAVSPSAPVALNVLLDNCATHVKQLGTLKSADLPLQ